MRSCTRRTAVAIVALAALSVVGIAMMPHPASASGVEIAMLAPGGAHTCALTEAADVVCWGSNEFGQIGDGGACGEICRAPVPVCAAGATPPCTSSNGNVLQEVVSIDAGFDHTCVLTSAAELKCWGDNAHGELGTEAGELCGSEPFVSACSRTPLDASNVTAEVTAIAGGDLHACAVTTAGGVKCWGSNEDGQLGDGTTTDSAIPVDVAGLANVVAISAGGFHTCAVSNEGGVVCWGRNVEGQIGDGRDCGMICPSPSAVSELDSGAASITAAGLHTCVLTQGGGVKCWGFNFDGQVGDGTSNNIRIAPVAVSGLDSGVVDLSANGGFRGHSCAVLAVGPLKCWGDNADGQLGDGTTTDRHVPVDIVSLGSGVTAVAAGSAHTCAVLDSDNVHCWGNNSSGQIGDGTSVDRHVPVPVLGFGGATGDANCDATVDSIDAALLLQLDAGLVSSLDCPKNADVNEDGLTTSVDAALVLQFVAGLIPSL
ncbi:MAG: dockerin type I domain-containing protein [Dehalococcoidia bacterium]|nr:dockerin type I domain-containing protein [Dehalococcoidia bacterium]